MLRTFLLQSVSYRIMALTLLMFTLTSNVAWAQSHNNEDDGEAAEPLSSVGVTGKVLVQPQWADTESRQPIAYQIILDVSGSMSWDFNGYGTVSRRDYQCDNPDNPNPLGLPYYGRCYGGPNSAWRIAEERRIYIAKQAINQLIDQLEEEDVMRIVAFTTGNDSIGDANAKAYPEAGWSSDRSALEEAVLTAGDWGKGKGPYNTRGGTSSAQAVQFGRGVWDKLPETAPNGIAYKQVAIFMTDGVANVFLNGRTNMARDICGNMPSQQATTTADPCQLGVTNNGTLRPITAMIDQANQMKEEQPGIDIYTIGLAQVDPTGLAQVASQPDMHFVASEPAFVDDILMVINERSEQITCLARRGAVTSDISGHEVERLSGFLAPKGGHGYVTIRASEGYALHEDPRRIPIMVDPVSSYLVYDLPAEMGLTPGEYSLEAYVNYRGNDGIARTYRWLATEANPSGSSSLYFTIPMDAENVYEMEAFVLNLAPDIDVCSTVAMP
ncbi:MAG: hypothetical protein AAGF95_15765 [Chloroflexota bacterium]